MGYRNKRYCVDCGKYLGVSSAHRCKKHLQERANFLKRNRPSQKALNFMGVPSEGMTLVYENYKEPLKKVEGGHGYIGTIAQNQEKTHIQCHICGFMFKSLGPHLRNHNLNARDYKQKFHLSLSTALLGDELRQARIKAREGGIYEKGKLPEHLKKYHEKRQEQGKPLARGDASWSLEVRNKKGICPDQVLEKIREAAAKNDGPLSYEDFQRINGNKRYLHTATYFFGSWGNAVKMAGLISAGDARDERYSKKRLIEYLKTFYKENGRTPMKSDFSRGVLPARYHYHKHWGTLNNARVEARIPTVIPLPGRRYIEMPPDKFVEYTYRKQGLTETKRRKLFSEIMA